MTDTHEENYGIAFCENIPAPAAGSLLGPLQAKIVREFMLRAIKRISIISSEVIRCGPGFDDFEFVEDHGSEKARQRRQNFNRRLTEKKSGCFFVWNTMVITSQGAVRPCCRNSSEFGLGNVLRDGVKEAWRSDPYNRLRLGFATESFGNTMHCVCKSCIGLAPQHSTETLVTISSKNAPKTEACFRQ